VGSAPHLTSSDDGITGLSGVNDQKEVEYHHKILFPTFTPESTSVSVFDLPSMAPPLPFNHGLPVCYAISDKSMGAQAIEAWIFFTNEGENSHHWIDTPFSHRWLEVMSLGGK
jgi:hypothetical protein